MSALDEENETIYLKCSALHLAPSVPCGCGEYTLPGGCCLCCHSLTYVARGMQNSILIHL